MHGSSEFCPEGKIAQIKALRIISKFTSLPMDLKEAKEEIDMGEHFLDIVDEKQLRTVGSPVQALVNFHKRRTLKPEHLKLVRTSGDCTKVVLYLLNAAGHNPDSVCQTQLMEVITEIHKNTQGSNYFPMEVFLRIMNRTTTPIWRYR